MGLSGGRRWSVHVVAHEDFLHVRFAERARPKRRDDRILSHYCRLERGRIAHISLNEAQSIGRRRQFRRLPREGRHVVAFSE